MAIPTFVAAGTFVSGTGAVSPGIPAGYAANDIFLLVCQTLYNQAVTTPAGWAQVTGSPRSTGDTGFSSSSRITVFWRRATASESAPTIADPGDHILARIHAFRGCETSGNPWNKTATNFSNDDPGTITFPSVTTTVDNCLIVLCNAGGYDNAFASGYTNSNLGSLTERSDNEALVGAEGGSLVVATGTKASIGSTGTTTADQSIYSVNANMTIALTEPALTIVAKSSSDTFVGADTESLLEINYPVDSDSGTGTESEVIVPKQVKLSTDTGTFSESGVVVASNSGKDYVYMTDPFGIKFKKGINEVLALADDFNTFDRFPVLGMSVPYNSTVGWTYDVGWRDIINDFREEVEQRSRSAQLEVVWESGESYTIPMGQTITIDVTSESDPFIGAVTPLQGTLVSVSDRLVLTPSDADFTLVAGSVTVTLSRTSGQSTKITINSTHATEDAIVQSIRLRAYPVRIVHKTAISNKDKSSIELNGLKSYTDGVPWANLNDMFAISEIILAQRFKRLPIVHFEINNGDIARLREALEVKLSDRIHINEPTTFTDEDFFVEQISHTIQQGGQVHRTVIGCEQVPVPLTGVFTFNDASHGFNQGVFADRSNYYHLEERLFILDQSQLGTEKVLGL